MKVNEFSERVLTAEDRLLWEWLQLGKTAKRLDEMWDDLVEKRRERGLTADDLIMVICQPRDDAGGIMATAMTLQEVRDLAKEAGGALTKDVEDNMTKQPAGLQPVVVIFHSGYTGLAVRGLNKLNRGGKA